MITTTTPLPPQARTPVQRHYEDTIAAAHRLLQRMRAGERPEMCTAFGPDTLPMMLEELARRLRAVSLDGRRAA